MSDKATDKSVKKSTEKPADKSTNDSKVNKKRNPKNSVSIIKPVADGYRENDDVYFFRKECHRERDIIWLPFLSKSVKGELIEVEADICQTTGLSEELVFPIDTDRMLKEKFVNGHRELSLEEKVEALDHGYSLKALEKLTPMETAFLLARKKAEKMKTPGVAIVCLNKKLMIPCTIKYNPRTRQSENLATIFNAISCYPESSRCVAIAICDCGSMSITTGIQYMKGNILDWQKRIEQERKNRGGNKPYNEYGDPYDEDNPNTGFNFIF